MEKTPLIVVSGPTASGKTALSIELAKEIKAEIVSADSMQIYKYMDIGTAKPDEKEKEGIIHHMMDFVDPKTPYSVADYVTKAHAVMEDIKNRGKNVIVTGGTGLYINSLVDDVDFCENDTDMSIREELFEIAENNGEDFLHQMLLKIDPDAAHNIHKNNVKRVVRAIEFYKKTGIKISEHQKETKKKESRYSPLMMAIRWDMPKLYERIEKRVDIMMENGLLKEVEALLEKGLTKDYISMKGIGYKELMEYLIGECSLEEAVDNIKIGTRHYAKRQMTWFRRDERIHWIDYNEDIVKKAKELIDIYYTG